MAEHDPLCYRSVDPHPMYVCDCAAIRRAEERMRADLRAKVLALPDVPGGRWFMRPAVYRHDVLALLDGSDSE